MTYYQRSDLTLIPDQEHIAKPVFNSPEEDEAFRRSFYESLRDTFGEFDLKHAKSNEAAKPHRVLGLH
jgi:hypothetical protein